MKKNIFLLAIVCFYGITKAVAQDESDVLRYSQIQGGGTARSISLANSTSSLGGDFSNASNNPAGLALYKSSEFTFSPAIDFGTTKSNYLGVDNTDRLTRFGLTNLGIVLKNNYSIKGKEVTKGWTGVAFAFGVNKLASFTNATTYTGFNKFSSIGDKYAADLSAKGVGPSAAMSADPWGSGLAYNSYLIDANSVIDSTHYVASNAGGHVNQTMNKIAKGAINEMAISFAGDYEHKLMVGGTLGIPFINYSQEINYTESDDSLYHPNFKNFNSTSSITASATGINLKLGATYLVNDAIRLGMALHTPTYYSFKDVGTIAMTTEREDSIVRGSHSESTTNTIQYSITTPWRAIGSAAFLFKKFGFITVEYEFVDYSSASIRFDSKNSSDIIAASNMNRNINKGYATASNLKIGAEIKLDIFAIRAGYANYGTPLKSSIVKDYNLSKQVLSFGFGVREKDYFFDMGIQKSMNKNIDIPYLQNNATSYAATLNSHNTLVVATVGFKF
ncbi:MAG: hypothetical protein RIQ33_1747 [Bacteroidota bacterium]|jgi:hypothetical protein